MDQETEVVEIAEKPKRKRLRRYYSTLHVSFELGYKAVEVFKMLFKEVLKEFCDEVPFEIHMDKLVIRSMDVSRVKMANLVFPKQIFEEWIVTSKGEEVNLPIRFQVPLEDVKYAIEDVGKDAKVRFDINVAFVTTKPFIDVEVRNPPSCPKCGRSTTWNQLKADANKRGRKPYKRGNGYRENYKCQCGKRFKLSVYTKKERTTETAVDEQKSTFIITVKEKTTDTYSIKPIEFLDGADPLPKLSPDARFKLNAKEFRKKIEKLNKNKDIDHVTLVGSCDKLVLQAAGDLTGVTVEMDKYSDILIDAEAKSGEHTLKLSLGQLMCVLPKKLADLVTIEYSTDMPLRTQWFMNLESTVEFFLAPRIDTDL